MTIDEIREQLIAELTKANADREASVYVAGLFEAGERPYSCHSAEVHRLAGLLRQASHVQTLERFAATVLRAWDAWDGTPAGQTLLGMRLTCALRDAGMVTAKGPTDAARELLARHP